MNPESAVNHLQNMTIALVVPQFPALSETFIVSKFLGLLSQGVDVHVVCVTSSTNLWAKFPQLDRTDIRRRVHETWPIRPRVRTVFLLPFLLLLCFIARPHNTLQYLNRGYRRFGLDIFRRLYLDAVLIRMRPSIVHFEFGALAGQRMYLKSLLDCKITVSFRGYDINYAGLDQPGYYNEVWQQADGFHFLGEDLRKRALRRGCPPDRPYALIPPAVNLEPFLLKAAATSLRSTDQPLRILSVGRLEWKKGYEFALQAMRIFIDQHGSTVEYRIIGDGKMAEALHFFRHQLRLVNNVTFLGALAHADVIIEMAQADIMLHAAVSEGFCNAVLEAQASGLPVITSDADGLSENVEDGITGFVVPRRNAEALAAKLLILANNPEIRMQMGLAGRQRIEHRFRLEDQIIAFEQFFLQFGRT